MNLRLSFLILCKASVPGLVAFGIVSLAAGDETAQSSILSEAQLIEPGEVQTHSQGAGQPVTYRFEAHSGLKFLIELDQAGLDFLLTIESPGGEVESFNSPLRRDERELILLEPATSGEYRITVDSNEPSYARGSYRLKIVHPPEGAEEGSSFIRGMRLMSDAAATYDLDDRESALRALSAYSDASVVWKDSGRERELAQSLFSVGMLEYWAAYDWPRSARSAAEAARIYQDLGLKRLFANAKMLQGVALIEAANEMERDQATEAFNDALTLLDDAASAHESLGNQYDLTMVRNNIGLTHYYMGDWDLARKLWEDSAEQFKELGEWREELNARQNIAVIDGQRGYNARASETLQYMLDALPVESDPQFRVIVLDNLAENQRRYGNYEEALRNYTAARTLHRALDDGIGETYSLSGIGNTYYSIGELELAERYLRLALPLAEAANDGRSREAILSRLGDIKYLQSEFTEALGLHEDAAKLATGEAIQARRLLSVARDLTALLRYEEAQDLAGKATRLADKAQSPAIYADAMMQVGRIQLAMGMPQAAESNFAIALASYESLGLKGGQADAYNGLALAARAEGQLSEAIAFGRSSLDLNESLREQFASPELRAHHSAASRRYYKSLIDMQMALANTDPGAEEHHVRSALTTSENGRARLTIDLLRSASVQLRSRADSELLDEERALFEELSAKAQQRDRLLRRGVRDDETQRNLTELDVSMTDIENRLNVLSSSLHGGDPGYASLSRSATLEAGGIQDALDEDSILLQYSLGEEKSFAWAVTRQSIIATEFADQGVIQELVLRIIDGLRSPDNRPAARRQLNDDLRALAGHVLHPFTTQLAGKRRVLVAPEAALEYIPFGALPATAGPVAQPLIETHEIVTLPSMSVVTALRSRGESKRGAKLAIFADPVVDEADPRLQGGSLGELADSASHENTLTRSSAELKRLPSTGVEAKTIAALLPQEDVHLALGFEANREQVLSMDLTPFTYLHFATHGIVDSRYPALSSLALSRYSANGSVQEGQLRLFEIFDLELNAQLVVLSACDTALGRQISGEGLIGLAQGFMYAGTRSLVASLWQVSDRATAKLMTQFYRYMLDPNKPMAPGAALRQAQLDLAESRRWNHPFYWSAFVLLGDWE